MEKSTHKCEVVPFSMTKHPGADKLSIVDIFGFQCVVATDAWNGFTKAAYIPPDSIVKVSRPEFSFLAAEAKVDGTYRVKAKRLRGVLSFGMLVPAPEGSEIGDNVADILEVIHYDPIKHRKNPNQGGLFMSGEIAKSPNVYCTKYDLDSGRRYAAEMFQPGEMVIVTEKIHGANSRYVFSDGQMHCGSRTEWKKEIPDYSHVTVESLVEKGKTPEEAATIVQKLSERVAKRNMWWVVLDRTPGLRKLCEANPDLVVYGEAFGAVQDLNYGRKKGDVDFVCFDMMKDGKWLNYKDAYALAKQFDVPWAPLLAEMPYDFKKICDLAEGKTTIKFPADSKDARHVREGCVIRPYEERYHPRLGRVCLKWVGAGYLEKSDDEFVSEIEDE